MRLLVAGDDEVDAGKTTFTAGLVERTGVRGFKPRAGNGYWYDHDDYRRAVETGRLYGKDAKRLADASPGDVRPEAINPVHRLWLPTPGRGKGLLGREGRAFLVDRVTDDDGTRYVLLEAIIAANLDRLFPDRSEERRVGKECASMCRSRWSPYH